MCFLVFTHVRKTGFLGAAPNPSEPKLHRAIRYKTNHECEWKDGGRLSENASLPRQLLTLPSHGRKDNPSVKPFLLMLTSPLFSSVLNELRFWRGAWTLVPVKSAHHRGFRQIGNWRVGSLRQERTHHRPANGDCMCRKTIQENS